MGSRSPRLGPMKRAILRMATETYALTNWFAALTRPSRSYIDDDAFAGCSKMTPGISAIANGSRFFACSFRACICSVMVRSRTETPNSNHAHAQFSMPRNAALCLRAYPRVTLKTRAFWVIREAEPVGARNRVEEWRGRYVYEANRIVDAVKFKINMQWAGAEPAASNGSAPRPLRG